MQCWPPLSHPGGRTEPQLPECLSGVLLLEPAVAQHPQGLVKMLFMEVSAYTTTGFELGALPQISDVSKLIVSLNMLFGRVGMFTFMLIFVRQQEPSPIRLPETRLPLT